MKLRHGASRFFSLALTLGLVCTAASPSSAPPLDRDEFTAAFVSHARERFPGWKAAIRGALVVEVDHSVRGEHTFFLDNAYRRYRVEGIELGTVLDHYTAALAPSAPSDAPDAIDLDRVVPVVKDAAFVEDMRRAVAAKSGGDFRMFAEPLNERLVVLYAIDSETSMAYLRQDRFEALAARYPDIRERALSNIEHVLAEVEVYGATADSPSSVIPTTKLACCCWTASGRRTTSTSTGTS